MTRSLVTGGAGFIGSHLVEALVNSGHTVTVVDNEYSDNDNFIWRDDTYNVNCDIKDYRALKNCFADGQDYVFHLAAEARIGPAIEDPTNAVHINTLGTCNVLQAARESGVKKVLYSSTSSGYGLNPSPNVETQPDDCLNPYSVSKVAGEKLCKMYTDLYGLPTVIFRYFNVFGERAPRRGQYAPVTGIFLRQKAAGESLTIVGDGEQRRDFIYVKDIARLNLIAAEEQMKPEQLGEVYNVGSGKNFSVLELADLISSDQVHLPPRVGEARTSLAIIKKTQDAFDWEPEVMIDEWIKEQL
tara:strand:- start:1086 stop:1985 length:900 start_codon:yes stop_codon:yes gene_type:complete